MTDVTGIKAVSFDVDGTLWDFKGAMRQALGQVLDELMRHDPVAARALDVATLTETRDRVHEELRGKVNDLNEVRRESFRRALHDAGRPDDALAARLTDVYFRQRDAGRAPFPDVRPALEALAPRYTLGIVSNGNTSAGELGMDGLMSFEVFAQDHGGVEKPDPTLFRIALADAGCAPEEFLHVGDSLENDVAGAAAVGARSVWLNRAGRELDGNTAPDLQVSSLLELVEVLQMCHNGAGNAN